MQIKYSVVIPVYNNAESIPRLLDALGGISTQLNKSDADGVMEAVFVIDGSPDNSFELLRAAQASATFPMQLLGHSRNFGSFAAVRSGLQAAQGDFVGVIAADLQEPPELLLEFFEALESDEWDVVIANRESRNDAILSEWSARLFWWAYRRFVVREMPVGGVDVFGCNAVFRDRLLELDESHSSLISLIFWLGFRRKVVPYTRLERQEGVSAWTLRKKLRYMADSIFAFTDLPIKLLTAIGALGTLASLVLAIVIAVARLTGGIEVSGYAATMLAILSLGSLNLLGLGLVGNYAWRTYENSKQRPSAVIATQFQSQHYTPHAPESEHE